jgi:hypothetical protein
MPQEVITVKAWMHRVAGWAGRMLGRTRSAPLRRRTPRARDHAPLERLERREVLSGGVALHLASLPGRIEAASQLAHVTLSLAPGQVTSERSTPVYMGFTADPAPGSSVTPRVMTVFGPSGLQSPVDKARSNPFITKITPPADAPSAFAVDVVGLDDKVGDFVLSAFLPGDADGNGSVDQDDLRRVQAAYGTYEGQSAYDQAADFNRDGRVGCLDRELTRRNLGAHASVVTATQAPAPVVTPPAPAAPPVSPAVVPPPPVVVPAQPQPVVVTPVQPQPVVVATPQPAQVVVANVQQQPVVVTPVQPAQVVVANVQQQPVVVTPMQPQAGLPTLVYTQPVQTVPVAATPVAQATPVGYAQPAGTVPVYTYGQPVGSAPVDASRVVQATVYSNGQPVGTIPVYDYGPPVGTVPVYTYGQPTGTVPVYTYGQPVVQAPVVAQPRPN